MAPEQVRDQSVDVRADVYALGVVLYESLAGEPPFTGSSAQAVLAEVLTADPKSLGAARTDIPPHVDAAVHRALSRNPNDRFPSASAFAAALAAPRDSLHAVTSPARQRARLDARWGLALAVGMTTLALGATLALHVHRSRDVASRQLPAASTPAPAEQRSVAVLPFDNVGGQQADEYFSDGLTEELIATLSQLRSLRVAARTSSFAFKRQTRDIREIARALNVASVLVGSVRTHDGRMRVTAQLVDASTGLDRWSGTYDERQLADVFGIQSDLALRIARALEANLSPAERGRISRKPTESLEAYTLYLKGRFAWAERGEGLMTALEYFRRAIVVDSQYARAYAGLASAYLPLAVHGYLEPRGAREKARDAATRAVALDSSLAEAHTMLATYLHVFEWNWQAAEREYRHAITLDPNEPTAHLWYGYMLEALGRFDEAIVERRRAIDLDPLAPNSGLAAALRKSGRYDLARAAYESVIAHHPGYWQAHEGLAQTLQATGALTDAANEFERAAALAGHTARPNAELARVLALAGRTDEARRLVAELRTDAASTRIYHPAIAMALDALGDRRSAIEWLETAYRQRHPGLIDISDNDAYGALRGDPHFEDLRRRIGFRR
jgi:serine/threonine-protein kinase